VIGAFSAKTIADLDIGYRIKDRFTLSIGASNRFDMVRVNMAVTTERVKWKAVVDLLTPPRARNRRRILSSSTQADRRRRRRWRPRASWSSGRLRPM
jgi:hypothetical protein